MSYLNKSYKKDNFGFDRVKKYLRNILFWNEILINNVANEYEKFLYLLSISDCPQNMSPSDSIDIFWHQHILDTKNYYNYCNNRFN